MNTIVTDAGRSVSYPEEKLDCAVRALAAFCRETLTYDRAHDIFERLGRKSRHKSYCTRSALWELGYALVNVHMNMSLSKFVKLNPKGRFFIHVRSHCFVLENSNVLDLAPVSGKRQVLAYAKFRE
jgi:hypothetical protein